MSRFTEFCHGGGAFLCTLFLTLAAKVWHRSSKVHSLCRKQEAGYYKLSSLGGCDYPWHITIQFILPSTPLESKYLIENVSSAAFYDWSDILAITHLIIDLVRSRRKLKLWPWLTTLLELWLLAAASTRTVIQGWYWVREPMLLTLRKCPMFPLSLTALRTWLVYQLYSSLI